MEQPFKLLRPRCDSPPLLLGVAKKALAFGGWDGLLEGPETELLPSQLALLVVRSCSSLIEDHISEGTRSAVTPRSSSNRVEPESYNQSDLVSDDESAEDRDSGGTITEGGLSSDEAGSDDDQRRQRRRWSPLDEVRLTAYMKENLPMPSIATRLNRSMSAILQHWRIMSAPQAGRGVPSPSRGGAVAVWRASEQDQPSWELTAWGQGPNARERETIYASMIWLT